MSKYRGKKTLEVLEGADNYNKWIASVILPAIKSPTLEIGAGIGNISEYFIDQKHLVLTDSDPGLVKFLMKKFKKRTNVNCEVLDISKQISTVKNRFNTIYAINVLEHIKDDQKALSNINLLLEKKGRVAILVPAKKFAFSKLDSSLGHFRRYEKGELREKLMNANFTVEKLEFFNVVGLLSWFVRDKVSRNDQHLSNNQVKLFDAVVPILRFLEPKKGLPLGISLVAIARKNE